MSDEQNSEIQQNASTYTHPFYPSHERQELAYSLPAFQIPSFMYTGPPALAHGGGAEVLPPGGSVWMQNNGFAPVESAATRHYDSHSPDSATTSSTYSSLHKAFDYEASSTPSDSYQSNAPFDYESMPTSTLSQAQPPPQPISVVPSNAPPSNGLNFNLPCALGLPVYSTSGFDILSVFGRVANRSTPQIQLGPVDLTSSFVVVDVRRHDSPIIYCSPTFCRLTGYEEKEIIGKNCRFLQAPPNVPVIKGQERKWTSNDAVNHIRKSLVANKEVQASVVNYRKDGSAFINLVTVIPVPEDNGAEPIYHLGFQVDLTEQPAAILDRLKDGSYIASGTSDLHPAPKKPPAIPAIVVSNTLSLPPPSSCDDSHPLSSILLSGSPDFILVVSLKGVFLYVAPAVAHVLGYSPHALVNKSLADIAHSADVIPLMRELKDASAPGDKPRHVDLLFRAKTVAGKWVWVECRGRLHVEPGKGRKAIVLCARVKGMNGLEAPLVGGVSGMVTPEGTILSATRDLGGYSTEELVGRSLFSLLDNFQTLPANVAPTRTLLSRRDGGKLDVEVRIWRQEGGDDVPRVYQITDAPLHDPGPSFSVFEELQTERDSSWQYEIQQLRFKNQRLEDQIRGLEEAGIPAHGSSAIPAAATYGTPASSFNFGDSETRTYPVSMPMWFGTSSSLKRSWDGGS